VLERFGLTVCLAHGGGCVPSLRGRMDMGWERKAVARSTSVPPSRLTDRLYYDTAVFSPVLLRRLVEDVGADHVLLGTDHPFELADFSPLRTVAELSLDPADARAVLGGNAAALLAGTSRGAAAEPDGGRRSGGR
jgi:aminocarboxymuconate-semialdehyde decarboxylase